MFASPFGINMKSQNAPRPVLKFYTAKLISCPDNHKQILIEANRGNNCSGQPHPSMQNLEFGVAANARRNEGQVA